MHPSDDVLQDCLGCPYHCNRSSFEMMLRGHGRGNIITIRTAYLSITLLRAVESGYAVLSLCPSESTTDSPINKLS